MWSGHHVISRNQVHYKKKNLLDIFMQIFQPKLEKNILMAMLIVYVYGSTKMLHEHIELTHP